MAGAPACGSNLAWARSAQDYDQWALIANLATENPHEGQAFERFTDQGPIAMLPIPDGAEESIAVRSRGRCQRTRLKQCFPARKKYFSPVCKIALGTVWGDYSSGERFGYPLKLEVCQEPVRPGIVVMGNVAHTLHPVAGRVQPGFAWCKWRWQKCFGMRNKAQKWVGGGSMVWGAFHGSAFSDGMKWIV